MKPRLLFAEARLDNKEPLARTFRVDPHTLTDSELILMAYTRWGERCPERLEGDFAFAIADDEGDHTFAARDPLGAKPLCYAVSSQGFSFAADARSLMLSGRASAELDETRIADVLIPVLEGSDATRTLYRDVKRLPPGHVLKGAKGHVRVSSYWSLEAAADIRFRKDDDYVEAFREVFARAVSSRLTGNAGSMLSGGLDSSAVVGFGAHRRFREGGSELPTLSAARPDASCEESRYIREMLSVPHLDPTVIYPEDVPDFASEIDAFFSGPSEPFDTTMIVPLLISIAARRKGLGAVLDGVDGDVVASLEPDFLEGLFLAGEWDAFAKESRGLGRFYRDTYPAWSSATRLMLGSAARALAPTCFRASWTRVRRGRLMRKTLADSLISREFAENVGVENRLRATWKRPGSRDPRARQIAAVLHPQIVAAVERYHRIAASQGLEARHPFLDRRLVEFCVGLPWEQKVRDGWTKFLVRRALEGLVPDRVRWRPGRWVRLGPIFLSAVIESRRELLWRAFHDGWRYMEPYVDRDAWRGALVRYGETGDPRTAESAWHVAQVAFWLQRHEASRYDRASSAEEDRRGNRGTYNRIETERPEETVLDSEDEDVRPPSGTDGRRVRERQRGLSGNPTEALTRYRFADSSVESAFALPVLDPLPLLDDRSPEVRLAVAKGAGPGYDQIAWEHHWRDPSGSVVLSCAREQDSYALGVPGTAVCHIREEGRTIEFRCGPSVPDVTVQHLLVDQVLPRVLSLRGRLVLHGGCVALRDGAVTFLGTSGAGKSTLCAAFEKAGWTLVSDDAVVSRPDSREGPRVIATYPSLRLYPGTLARVLPGAETVPMAHPGGKLRVRRSRPRGVPESRAFPLRAQYVLSPLKEDADEVRIETLGGSSAFLALLHAAFQLHLGDRDQALSLFERISSLCDQVPIRRLVYRRSLDALPRVVEAVRADLGEPSSAPALPRDHPGRGFQEPSP